MNCWSIVVNCYYLLLVCVLVEVYLLVAVLDDQRWQRRNEAGEQNIKCLLVLVLIPYCLTELAIMQAELWCWKVLNT